MTQGLVGTTIGRYRVLGPIGRGGMGAVYRARDERLARDVALKVIGGKGREDDPEQRARFLREARALASLSHPNVAAVLDFGGEQGVAYIVMELVEGRSLRERLRDGPLPLDEALRVGLDVAAGLDAAHTRGIVHRDVKPDNVVLMSTGRAKLVDFGLAKLIDASPADASQSALTADGALLGTPQYMAPEQARGVLVDARADVFAIGALLYEVLSGRPAFAASSVVEALVAVQAKDEEPLERLAKAVPPAVADLVHRCLRKDPDRRPRDAGEVVRALATLASTSERGPAERISRERAATDPHAPTLPGAVSTPLAMGAVRPSTPESPLATRPSTTLRSLVVAGMLTVTGLGLGGVVLGVGVDAGGDAFATRESDQDAGAAGLREPLVGLGAFEAYRNDTGRSRVASRLRWEAAAEDLVAAAEQPGAPGAWLALAHCADAFVHAADDEPERALADADGAVAADATSAIAQAVQSEMRAAVMDIEGSLASARTAARLDPDWALPTLLGARALARGGRAADAVGEYRLALDRTEGSPPVRGELALALYRAGFEEAAESEARRALEESDDVVEAHVVIAEQELFAHGRVEEAVRHAERALALAPNWDAGYIIYGDALAIAGRNADARAAYARALDGTADLTLQAVPEARLEAARAYLADSSMIPWIDAVPEREAEGRPTPDRTRTTRTAARTGGSSTTITIAPVDEPSPSLREPEASADTASRPTARRAGGTGDPIAPRPEAVGVGPSHRSGSMSAEEF